MNPLGTRARVEELAALLEGGVSGPDTPTAGHAALAFRLQAVAPDLASTVVPRPEFRAALRTRLVAVATVQAATLATAPAPACSGSRTLGSAGSLTETRKAQRRMGVAAAAMAGVVAFAGVGVAASRSLPGQPFYGLKRGTEDVQLALAHGDTAKGRTHLEFAATRLREVQAMTHGDGELSLGAGTTGPVAAGAFGASTQTRINRTLADFSRETRAGQALLERAYRASGGPEPLRILTAFSTLQRARLVAVLTDLPAGSRASAERALQLVSSVGRDARQLLFLGGCGGECFPQGGGPTPQPTSGTLSTPTATPNRAPTDQLTTGTSGGPSVTGAPTAPPSPAPGSLPIEPALPTSQPTIPPLPTILPTALPTLLPSILPVP